MDFNLVATAIIVFAGLLLTDKGETLTCHCTQNFHTCSSENSTCTVNDPNGYNVCRASVQLEDDGTLRFYQWCETDPFVLALCENSKLQQHSYWCAACCTDDYCNSEELVQDIKDQCFPAADTVSRISSTNSVDPTPTVTTQDRTASTPPTSTPPTPNSTPPTQIWPYAAATVAGVFGIIIIILTIIITIMCVEPSLRLTLSHEKKQSTLNLNNMS